MSLDLQSSKISDTLYLYRSDTTAVGIPFNYLISSSPHRKLYIFDLHSTNSSIAIPPNASLNLPISLLVLPFSLLAAFLLIPLKQG